MKQVWAKTSIDILGRMSEIMNLETGRGIRGEVKKGNYRYFSNLIIYCCKLMFYDTNPRRMCNRDIITNTFMVINEMKHHFAIVNKKYIYSLTYKSKYGERPTIPTCLPCSIFLVLKGILMIPTKLFLMIL